MRLILRLQATKNQLYDLNYNRKFQSIIYNLLKNTDYNYLHDFIKYKNLNYKENNIINKKNIPFSFSNIFPYGHMKYGNIKNIIISSPENNLIFTLNKKIKENPFLNLGKSTFKVLDCKVYELNLNSLNFTTMTPVIIRIPRKVYRYYDLKLNYPYKYIFWRKRFPLDLFIKQMELNLKKKYHSYHNKNTSANIFNSATLILRKQISHKISISGKEQIIIGTIWDFWFDKFGDKRDKLVYENDNNDKDLFKEDFEVLKFAIESGFGERNSLGYGFANPL